jgi:hypothetical protein
MIAIASQQILGHLLLSKILLGGGIDYFIYIYYIYTHIHMYV